MQKGVLFTDVHTPWHTNAGERSSRCLPTYACVYLMSVYLYIMMACSCMHVWCSGMSWALPLLESRQAIVDHPVDAKTRRHVERKPADHQRQELEDLLCVQIYVRQCGACTCTIWSSEERTWGYLLYACILRIRHLSSEATTSGFAVSIRVYWMVSSA